MRLRRLPCKGIEARLEADRRVLDDREIGNVEFDQHAVPVYIAANRAPCPNLHQLCLSGTDRTTKKGDRFPGRPDSPSVGGLFLLGVVVCGQHFDDCAKLQKKPNALLIGFNRGHRGSKSRAGWTWAGAHRPFRTTQEINF